jgi:transposase
LKRGVGRPIGESCRMGRADLAQAYEMYQAGVIWRHIACHFGVDDRSIYRYFKRCERFGLAWLKKP